MTYAVSTRRLDYQLPSKLENILAPLARGTTGEAIAHRAHFIRMHVRTWASDPSGRMRVLVRWFLLCLYLKYGRFVRGTVALETARTAQRAIGWVDTHHQSHHHHAGTTTLHTACLWDTNTFIYSIKF